MKAVGRVKKPTRISTPPINSARPVPMTIGPEVEPAGSGGNPSILAVPCSRNNRAVTMRSDACNAGVQDWGRMLTFTLSLPLLKDAGSSESIGRSLGETLNGNRSARVLFFGVTRILGCGYLI